MFENEALKRMLLDVDEEAFLALGPLPVRPKVVIVGGSALMLRDLTSRPATHDVDVLEADAELERIFSHYPAINASVAAHADEIPYNFESRLTRLDLPTQLIDYLTPSLEDLVVMKLYAWRPNDIADLTSSALLAALDWELLEHLVYDEDESRASTLSERRWHEMTLAYEQFKKGAEHAADV